MTKYVFLTASPTPSNYFEFSHFNGFLTERQRRKEASNIWLSNYE